MNIEQLYKTYLRTRKVTTDSRHIVPGCIFFAFEGASFDGNAFAAQALEQGAALCVISKSQYAVDERCVVVPDVLDTLQQLARYHRDRLSIPIIGITGTNGKTTTKELVHAVLGRCYRIHATEGNFNNHLGVPITVLSIPADAEIAIIEMGANHPGEIESLCGIANPDFGLVTNVGRAHLEGFGNFEGVVQTKTELYRHLLAKGGMAFVNADSDILVQRAAEYGLNMFGYGSSEQARVRGHLVGADPYMKCYIEEGDKVYTIQSQLLGSYNFDNVMAAAAVGLYFRVDMWDIKEAVEQYVPANKRSQYKETERNALFLDCYNANPSSMQVALDNFEALPKENKVAMLGGMHELGDECQKEHEAIVGRIRNSRIRAVLVGEEFKFASTDSHILWFANVEEAKSYFSIHPLDGATILLKGSNTTRMWELETVL